MSTTPPITPTSADEHEANVAEGLRLFAEAEHYQAQMNAFNKSSVTRRSRVFDRIGRILFFAPEVYGLRPDFFYIAGDRAQDLNRQQLRENVRDEFYRRDIRAFLSKVMIIPGAVVAMVGWAAASDYASALSHVHI